MASGVGGLSEAASGQLAEAFASEAAFSAWYERVLPRVYGYVYSRCGHDHDLAEDLTQVTFIEAIRCRARFDGRSDPVTWLCGIARHKLVDHYRELDRIERRDQRVAAQTLERKWSGDDSQVEEREAILVAMAGLPALQRAVLILTALDDLSVREAATLLERSESATESLLHRARIAFREAYGRLESSDD
jgi:RNA polymerase sigma-70 factor (ECF subfamily)